MTTPGKTTGIKDQSQGNQGTIGPFFLGMTMGSKSIGLALSLKIGIGQVIQGDGFLQAEETAFPII